MKLRQQMEESQSAEKLGAPSWLVYDILLYSSFFFCILLAFCFSLVFSTIFQEQNTQKSLHNTADKDVTKIRKVWWLWKISDYFLRFIFIFICQNSGKKRILNEPNIITFYWMNFFIYNCRVLVNSEIPFVL